MAIRESALNAINSIATSDFVRAVTSAGASSNVTVANLAKSIIENYSGSTLAGSSQSVKSAIDAAQTAITEMQNVMQPTLLRKTASYSNITVPSAGYTKIDSYGNLGVSSSMYLVSMEIRGWSGSDVPKIVKGSNGTDIHAVGAGTYSAFTVEYYFTKSVDVN